ncbi:uncharacterized protein ATC70_009212 [Mucor velutinosus]|uniref:Uncharacterized protein n=1 Tax=Mucor velutinosus TaxID=708070 RepID=A0AAN7DQB8_9FUNG|nr:hypothetical protein ATC70_009212 [Mucor velutinosus]
MPDGCFFGLSCLVVASLVSISGSCFFNLCLVSSVARSSFFSAIVVAAGVADDATDDVAAGVAYGAAAGIAAASPVFLGLLSLFYACFLVYLW